MTATPLALGEVHAADFARGGCLFTDGSWLYRTLGTELGSGGAGIAWLAERRPTEGSDERAETVVAKIYRDEIYILLRDDPPMRTQFRQSQLVLEVLARLRHPNVVPLYLSTPIADNHLLVSRLGGDSVMGLLAAHDVPAGVRTRLLLEALRGLAGLHAAGIIHRDFTLNNILVEGGAPDSGAATLFDFDLSLLPDRLDGAHRSYHTYYQGRLSGTPEFSVAPELVDEALSQHAISPRVDVYAAGTAIFSMYTAASLYGDTPDLSTLLYRIGEGLVHRGESRIPFPDEVPHALRPIVVRCLERDPEARYADAGEVLSAFEEAAGQPSLRESKATRFRITMSQVPLERKAQIDLVYATRSDENVTLDEVRRMDAALAPRGYRLERSFGSIKGHPIFLATPDPAMVMSGRFAEDNNYPKIVTGIDIDSHPGGLGYVDTWLSRIRPIIGRVREGLLTSFYTAVHDRPTNQLLLFSEYVDDARFGTDLAAQQLTLPEVFGLGLIVAHQIARLHREKLAHNNVRPESLLFQGRHQAGEVRVMFVGLVEPSFEPEAREEDVRNLANMLGTLIRDSRVDALLPVEREGIRRVREQLALFEVSEVVVPTIEMLITAIASGLGILHPNFELLRTVGGDLRGYAELLVTHSLYNKLYGRAQRD